MDYCASLFSSSRVSLRVLLDILSLYSRRVHPVPGSVQMRAPIWVVAAAVVHVPLHYVPKTGAEVTRVPLRL